MRILLSSDSKKRLFILLKKKYLCNSIKELSDKIRIPTKTLQGWFYLKDRYISEELIKDFDERLEILDKKVDYWGKTKGGKASYKKTINTFGLSEVKRRQSLGGKMAAKTKEASEIKRFSVDLDNPLFLEFYGILLGDGWLSNFKVRNKKVWLIGISSNLRLDKEFVVYYKMNIKELFKREGTTRKRIDNNVSEFIFGHKILLKYLNERLNFPIGKKENLEIPDIIYSLGFDKVKYVIRGIFDTDGSIYLERNRKGIPSYPIISIHMKEQRLINQIGEMLGKEGFKVNYSDNNYMIKIKGRHQIKKWLDKIGSSNSYKLNKIIVALK